MARVTEMSMARGQSGRAAKIAAVDGNYLQPHQEPDRATPYQPTREDILAEKQERMWREQLRGARSSAYWFAASKWGMMGLIFGMILGGAGMYFASVAIMEPAQNAIERGQAMADARHAMEQERATEYAQGRNVPDRAQFTSQPTK